MLRIAVRRCREKPCERYKNVLIDMKKAHLTKDVPEDEKVFAVGGWGRRGSFAAVAFWHQN